MADALVGPQAAALSRRRGTARATRRSAATPTTYSWVVSRSCAGSRSGAAIVTRGARQVGYLGRMKQLSLTSALGILASLALASACGCSSSDDGGGSAGTGNASGSGGSNSGGTAGGAGTSSGGAAGGAGTAGSGGTAGAAGSGGAAGGGGTAGAGGGTAGSGGGGKCPECVGDTQCDQKGKLATVCVGGTCRDAPGTGQAGAECWSDKQCSGVGASCVGVAACDCGAVCIQDSPGKCVLPK